MKFGLFYTKTLKKSKTAITLAYDVEKKRIIYQTEEHVEESSISTAIGRFGNFQNPKIRKGKKVIAKIKKKEFFNFFCDFESQSLNLWSKYFFDFLKFLVKIVKLWSKQSNCGQTIQTIFLFFYF